MAKCSDKNVECIHTKNHLWNIIGQHQSTYHLQDNSQKPRVNFSAQRWPSHHQRNFVSRGLSMNQNPLKTSIWDFYSTTNIGTFRILIKVLNIKKFLLIFVLITMLGDTGTFTLWLATSNDQNIFLKWLKRVTYD